jgi:hypothetical protein
MRSTKLYAGIDYDFQPESYWAAARNPLEAALRNVKGRNRRGMIRDYHEVGNLEELDPTLLTDSLDSEERESLGSIDPPFMGGEYLPSSKRGEVEITRIELASTTSDVITIRARPSGLRILYRVCDEYNSTYKLPRKSSRQPFSLLEFIRFLDAVDQGCPEPSWSRFGFVLEANEGNLASGASLEDLQEFTRVDSDFYPELERHYANVIDEWYQARSAELSAD